VSVEETISTLTPAIYSQWSCKHWISYKTHWGHIL